MSEQERAVSTNGAAPISELPDRAEPRLVTQYGEPLETSTALEKSRDFSKAEVEHAQTAARATESQRDERRARAAAEPAVAGEAAEQAQRMRRVEEFAREKHSVEAWGGGEHSGTVVAAVADAFVIHVGRNEYVRVPAQKNQPFAPELLGRLVSVNRGGAIVETPPGLERPGR